MIKVLFVCLGNICRSPMAEGYFKKIVRDKGLEHFIQSDSSGTAAYHIGKQPDKRMCETAKKNGINLLHNARQLISDDFQRFDYILAMDKSNYDNIKRLEESGNSGKAKIFMMRDFDPEKNTKDVPDPYYGGIDGFEEVYDILKRSNNALLDFLIKEHQL